MAVLSGGLGAAVAPAATLEGRIVLEENGRPSRDRSLDLRAALVWYEPDGAGEKPRPVDAEMSTRRKQFEPRVLVVPVGSTVRFPNFDPILRNAFPVSEPKLALEVSVPRVLPHRNEFGRRYRRGSYD